MIKSALLLLVLVTTGSGGVNHATEGMLQASVGDYVGAMKSFRMARSDQMEKEAYMAWGLASSKMGKYRSAAAKYGMAAGRDPKDGDPLALMGECYLRGNAPRDAIAAFARVKNRPLSDPVGMKIMWATATNMVGVYEQGLALFREAGKIAPPERKGEIVRGEAASLIGLRRFRDATQLLDVHLNETPNDSLALALLGEAYLKDGAYDRATRSLEEALAKGAPVGPTAYNLACAESRREKWEAACEALKRSCASGFECRKPMESDPDLAPLKGRGCLK